MARGYFVKLFLPDGDPSGLKLVEKSNWIGTGVVFPRSLYSKLKDYEHVKRAGVYILAGKEESTQLSEVYIGEGDPIQPRLDSHIKEKEFWTQGVAFTSKDNNLNKAHIQYLEARLVQLAREAKRCILKNANTPQLPTLSMADQAEMESFLDDVMLCLPTLGFNYFEVQAPTSSVAQQFRLQGKGVSAVGYESSEGFVVKAKSQATREAANSIHGYLKDHRTALLAQGVLTDKGFAYEFTQDYTFSSPSTAAGVILGRSANGRDEWKTPEGRTLKSVQESWASTSTD